MINLLIKMKIFLHWKEKQKNSILGYLMKKLLKHKIPLKMINHKIYHHLIKN